MHRPALRNAGFWDATPSMMGRPGICTIDDDDFVDPDEGYSAGAGSDNGDDEGRRHRFTSHEEAERGYAELQSQRSKDVNEFRTFKSEIEKELQSLRGTNQQEAVNTELRSRGLDIAGKVVERIKKANLDNTDPEYHKKYFGELITTILEENNRDRETIPKTMQEIARSTMSEEERFRKDQEEGRKVATSQAMKELKAYGMSEEDLQEIIDKRDAWNHRDPDWTKRVAVDKQIPMLVEEIARRRGLQRQEAQDEGGSPNNGQTARTGDYPSLHPRSIERSADETSRREAARLEQKRRAGGMNGGANVNQRGNNGQPKGGDLGSFTGDMRSLRQHQRGKSANIANRA